MADVRNFLLAKVRNLASRARRLSSLTRDAVGIRPQDEPFTPSAAHFDAANRRLGAIDADLTQPLNRLLAQVRRRPVDAEAVLRSAALVERDVDRARRMYGLFFDVFSQRGSSFAPALAACDAIAADCYRVIRVNAPGQLRRPLLKPVAYLEPSFSPATFRRGVMLRRLLGERNPFPLVRIPHERVESPWGMGVVLHEIGHNLHADLGIWQENHAAVQRRVMQVTGNAWLTRIWARWHKEIFADLIALLLGGPASAYSMCDFLAYPGERVLSFRPLGVHPVPYLRAFVLAQMLLRMGFRDDAYRLHGIWNGLYEQYARRGRVPAALLLSADRVIPQVVDEVAFQTRRGLAQRTLADIVPYGQAEEAQVKRAADAIGGGRLPLELPPRLAVSASRYAFDRKLASPAEISRTVLSRLAERSAAATRPRAAAHHPPASVQFAA